MSRTIVVEVEGNGWDDEGTRPYAKIIINLDLVASFKPESGVLGIGNSGYVVIKKDRERLASRLLSDE